MILQRKCACGGSAETGAECANCEQKKLERKATDVSGATTVPPIVDDVLRSPGQPLDAGTRAFFEPRFGHDFSKVRVHADGKAAESARSVNALAYTVGNDLVFSTGQFAPGTRAGQQLLAHELTHVVQQASSAKGPLTASLRIAGPKDALEEEAHMGEALVAGNLHVKPSRAEIRLSRQSAPPQASPPAAAQSLQCGPDATDWFISQVAAAKRDPIVLEIKRNLEGAHRVAARFGFSAERVAEGGIAKKVLAEEQRAGSPSRAGSEAENQLRQSVPSQQEFGRALIAATAPIPFVGAPEQIVLLAIRRAANAWKDLVGTGRRYDFKNDTGTMQGPTSAHCPTSCANTVTLCPGTGPGCFRTDVPGNLFYAHVGRFVGWTELSLQLGSEFAQLESTRTWDPPDDTRMISAGFALPDPLSRSNFCAAMAANGSGFSPQPCSVCPETSSAVIR